MIQFNIPDMDNRLVCIVGVDIHLICKTCQGVICPIVQGVTQYQFDKTLLEKYSVHSAYCGNCGYTETAICCQLSVSKQTRSNSDESRRII